MASRHSNRTEHQGGYRLDAENEELPLPSPSAPITEEEIVSAMLLIPTDETRAEVCERERSLRRHDEDCEIASNRLALKGIGLAQESSDKESLSGDPFPFFSPKASSSQDEGTLVATKSKRGRGMRSTACCVSFSLLFVLILGGLVLVAFTHRQSKKDYEIPDLADYEQHNITIMEKSEGMSTYSVVPIAPTCINDPQEGEGTGTKSIMTDFMVERIKAGQFVCSPSRRYRFGLRPSTQSPSELVVVDHDQEDRIVWTSGMLVDDDKASTDSAASSLSLDLKPDGTLLLVNDKTSEVVRVVVKESSNATTIDLDEEYDGGSTTLRVDDLGVATIYNTHKGHVWSTATAIRSADGSSTALLRINVVDTSTLERKVMAGYQGWFGAEGDGNFDEWAHWADPRNVRPNSDNLVFDLWPDLRELEPDELYETDLVYRNGARASVFSSSNTKTVERHTRWMSDYGLDGVFVQRFVTELFDGGRDAVDQVLMNVRGGCEKYGRAFVVMYDIVGVVSSRVVDAIIVDWRHLVDDLRITQSPSYLRHRGRPLVAIWGIGFVDVPTGLSATSSLLNFFRAENGIITPGRFRTSVMAGVPIGWRDLGRDSQSAAEWVTTFRRFDVLSPWTVGRYNSLETADGYRRDFIIPDMQETQDLGIDYLPVAFPGFSQFNLNNKPFNEIQRLGGTFFWRQLFNMMSAGNSMIYIAMFDEVDEATAIFKAADRQGAIPRSSVLSLNDDGGCVEHVPSDWYLQLSGEVARYAQSSRTIPRTMPSPGTISGFPLQIAQTPVPLSVRCFNRGPRASFQLELNQYVCSPNRAYALGLNGQGNFVILNILNGRMIWQAGIQGGPGTQMIFQSDGNLVVSRSNQVLFATSTAASGGNVVSTLVVNNRGRATITQTGRGIVWTSWCVDDGPAAVIELGILEAICSPDHQYRFGVTNSGNLGLFRTDNEQVVWSTSSNAGQSARMVLQQDGNLVLSGNGGRPVFTTGTNVASNLDVPTLIVDDGGVASVIHSTRGVVWTTTPCSGAGPSAPFDLGRNTFRCSPDGRYRFGLTIVGELSMFNNLSGQKVWDAGIREGSVMSLQTNGDLVVVGPGNAVLFRTNTVRTFFFQSTALNVGNNGVTTLVRDGFKTLWASGCINQNPTSPSALQVGEYVCSPNRNFVFGLTDEGRLRSFNSRTDVVRWDPGILVDLGSRIVLQPDGNVVVRDSQNAMLFATNTAGTTTISVDNGGNVLVRRQGQRSPVFNSRTEECQ